MTTQDFILSYERDGKIVCNLFDYYTNYIKPLDQRFKPYDFNTGKLVLCWFKKHADLNPSMGFINDREHRGGKIYHCFGCGRAGNVIRLHQHIQYDYYNRTITEIEACKELAELFNIPLEEIKEAKDDDLEAKYRTKSMRIDEMKSEYTYQDYKYNMIDIRKKGSNGLVNLEAVNRENVKLIATIKQLYN